MPTHRKRSTPALNALALRVSNRKQQARLTNLRINLRAGHWSLGSYKMSFCVGLWTLDTLPV